VQLPRPKFGSLEWAASSTQIWEFDKTGEIPFPTSLSHTYGQDSSTILFVVSFLQPFGRGTWVGNNSLAFIKSSLNHLRYQRICSCYTLPALAVCLLFAFSASCMTMQGPRSNCGSSSTVNDLDTHRQSTSQSPLLDFPPPYATVPSPAPSYASSVDNELLHWWDVEAEKVLRGSDLQAMQLLCRFHTYRDDSLPRSILRTRSVSTLNTFLLHLGAGTNSRQAVVDLDVDQKVEEILKRLIPSLPPSNSGGNWVSHKAVLQQDASRVASELNEASFLEFQKISFPDWVREALYPDDYVDPVEDFIDWHNGLIHQVYDHLKSCPDEIEKYNQIEKVNAITVISFVPLTDTNGRSYASKAPSRIGL